MKMFISIISLEMKATEQAAQSELPALNCERASYILCNLLKGM